MGNIIEDIYHKLKEKNIHYEPMHTTNDWEVHFEAPPEPIWHPISEDFLTPSETVGNYNKKNIKKYSRKKINSKYYTNFNIKENNE